MTILKNRPRFIAWLSLVSIIAILLGIVITATTLTLVYNRMNKYQEAIETVKRHGIEVEYGLYPPLEMSVVFVSSLDIFIDIAQGENAVVYVFQRQ